MANEGEQAAAQVETVADFLANLDSTLRGKKDIDVGLVDILAKHLLTAAPTADAVANAKDAILKLAGERATRKPEADIA